MRAIAACQRGDRSAYEILVKNYGSRAIGIARGIVQDATLAEDMAQEAFVRAYRAIKRFDLSKPFYPWFYRILKNCCLSALKRRRTGIYSLDAENAPPVEGPPSDPAERAEAAERRALIDGAMAKLKEHHREILHLAHFESLSYKQIAACLEIPIGTVMSRLWAARKALKRELEPLMNR